MHQSTYAMEQVNGSSVNDVTDKSGKVAIQMPHCLLYTKAGCVPYLTQETLSYLDKDVVSSICQVPLPSVIGASEVVKAFPGPASELFSVSPHCHLYVTVQDSSELPPKGYNSKSTVAVWNSSGKINVTAHEYMRLIESMQPSLYQSLADGDVLPSDSRKRVIKSVDRSLQHLDDCLKFHTKSKALQNTEIVCVIEGGLLIDERKRCVKLMNDCLSKQNIEPWGYVIDAIPLNPLIATATKDVLQAVIAMLPKDKPIAVHGHGHPLAILDLVEAGVNLFDSAYVFVLCERNLAFTYRTPSEKFFHCSMSNNAVAKVISQIEPDYEKFVETINLSDPIFAKDFTPVVMNCLCYTCAHHTRAYIHHLINVDEMLAPVLLMLHNLHYHFNFFQVLRKYIEQSEIHWLRQELCRLNMSD